MLLTWLCRILLSSSIFLCIAAKGQDTTTQLRSPKFISEISKRSQNLQTDLDKQSQKALSKLEKQEGKINRKLSRLDSSKAKELFSDANEKYTRLKQRIEGRGKISQYIPYLDTLKTSFNFLEENKDLLGKGKDVDKRLSGTAGKLKDLEYSFANAEYIKAFIKERKEYFKERLHNLPFSKELKNLNKQAYYYTARLNEYKDALKDSKKLERKAIEILSKTKAFQDFMLRNSELASLFQLPGNDGPSGIPVAGLQTRAAVSTLIQDRLGSVAQAQTIFRQNMQAAQSQLSQLKEQISQYSNGSFGNSSSDLDVPDFKPNNQKTKSFLKRLEYGGNVQSQRARMMFPITSDLGLSLGYKLNDKSAIGVGASYKFGLGKGWDNIKITNEGIGLRTFIDWKLKGSLFISGGYEQNHRSRFSSFEQLRSLSSWQSSGLIGLSKKYNVSKKLKGNVQLLWDFLSYRQVPQTQAVLFRLGYSLK
jgi:hypothetical protein